MRVELAAPQAAPRRHEVDADDLAHLVALLEQLGDAGAQLAAHAGDEDAHQPHASSASRSGRAAGRGSPRGSRYAREQHHEPVDADAEPAARRAARTRARAGSPRRRRWPRRRPRAFSAACSSKRARWSTGSLSSLNALPSSRRRRRPRTARRAAGRRGARARAATPRAGSRTRTSGRRAWARWSSRRSPCTSLPGAPARLAGHAEVVADALAAPRPASTGARRRRRAPGSASSIVARGHGGGEVDCRVARRSRPSWCRARPARRAATSSSVSSIMSW